MGGLQIKIEVVALQGMAIGSCFGTALAANSSNSDHQEHHFHGLESGLECVREQSTYEFAETLENVDFVFIVLSIIILFFFLIENILFIVAFRCNYFKIIFFPLDLVVVLLSLGTEFLALLSPSLEDIENPLETLGPNSSMSNGAISPLIAVLILGRFWRFIRIGHAVYLLQGAEEIPWVDKWVFGTFGDRGIVKAIGSKTIKSTFGSVIMLRKEMVIFTKH